MKFQPRRLPLRPRRFKNPHPRADHGPLERWQHSGRALELTEEAGILAARVTEEHLVDRLLAHGFIAANERDAALKFKLDYHAANLEARLTGRYSPIRNARDFFAYAHERSDAEEAAYQRWRNAVRELGAPLADGMISVICHDRAPRVEDMADLRRALAKLAEWYGLRSEAVPAARSGENIHQAAAR